MPDGSGIRATGGGRLLRRLLVVQVLLLAATLLAAWLAVETRAADSFMTLMKEYGIETGEVEGMFRESTRAALLAVGGGALLVAVGLGSWLTHRLLRRLDLLAAGSARLAAGERGHRIPERKGRGDELDALVARFNAMAAALERNESLRRAMVVGVAHELRTPLTNLRGTVEALQDGLLAAGPDTLRILHDELGRLERLTEDLVQAGRATGAVPRRVPTDVRAVVDRTLELFRARLLQRDLEVDDRFVGGVVAADPDHMMQVCANLLQNAVQFAPAASSVVIEGGTNGAAVRLAVANAGPPIPAGDCELVFEPYYRVDRSRSRSRDAGGGAGIGLAIVRGLVEAHGGTVGAASADGITRVWVELPRAATA